MIIKDFLEIIIVEESYVLKQIIRLVPPKESIVFAYSCVKQLQRYAF